jgi:hypothetical protein
MKHPSGSIGFDAYRSALRPQALWRSIGDNLISPQKYWTIAVTSIQTFFFAASIMSLGTEKNTMKACTNDKVKSKFHEVKANEKLRKVMNDPTLEGKDENKVGRFQGKSGRVVKAFQK